MDRNQKMRLFQILLAVGIVLLALSLLNVGSVSISRAISAVWSAMYGLIF